MNEKKTYPVKGLPVSYVCGIYGYHITKPIDLPHGLKIMPLFQDHFEVSQRARNPHNYQLTAVLMGTSISDDLLSNLEAILSFVEHIDVLITSPKVQTDASFVDLFQDTLTIRRHSDGEGSIFMDDTVSPNSRKMFILKTLDLIQSQKLYKEGTPENTQFNVLFFKYVESFRQPRQFVDIKYFLLFSGLETYARKKYTSPRHESASVPICKLLKEYGFKVDGQEITGKPKENLHRTVATYAHLRNALFHNSELTYEHNLKYKKRNKTINLNMYDYLTNFKILISLVILKAVEFEDENTNWDSWIDLQPWKSTR